MRKHNVLMVLVDALRFDQFADESRRGFIAPNLDQLVRNGLMVPLVTNSHTTKFAMPSLFSQSLPLDYGGYNHGLANRPRSFVELIKEDGYHTIGVFSHDLHGKTAMYERGFDEFFAIYDRRLAIRNYIEHVFSHYVSLWQKKVMSLSEITVLLQNDFGAVVDQCAKNIHRTKGASQLSILGENSGRWCKKFLKEAELISRDPELVLEKLLLLPPHLYADYAGRKKRFPLFRFRQRLGALIGRLQGQLRKFSWYNFQLLPYRVPAIASELVGVAAHSIRENTKGPWFCYVHLMDVHDSRQLNRPFNFLYKLLVHGKACWRGRKSEKSSVPFSTDLALSYIDHEVGKLVRDLNNQGKLDDTIVVLTADHGNGWDSERDTSLAEDFGFRTHYEHTSVPLLIYHPDYRRGKNRLMPGKGLFDSMSVSATILDLLNVEQDPVFKGSSILGSGKPAIISENAGRGNCDTKNRDLYFTITSTSHKLFVLLKSDILVPKRLYDIEKDPRELNNIISDSNAEKYVSELMKELFSQRADLLQARGVELGAK